MAEQKSPFDPNNENKFIHNPDDDTLTRHVPFTCTTPEDHNSIPNQTVFTKDIPLNTTRKTWLRIFKPIHTSTNTKLPIIVYFHGGGFILFSASAIIFHDFCTSMSIHLSAIVVSVSYRLAPENRLPAAYDDAADAIHWIRNQSLGLDSESLLMDIADFSNCYLMGVSAGGNIAYHAVVQALSQDLQPLVIRGCILNQPYFSGQQRTQSELRMANDKIFTLAMSDMMWELGLPRGCDRDHEYCNPLLHEKYKDKIGLVKKCFVSVRGGDILMDRQLEFAKMLEGNGVSVVTWFSEDGYHGMDVAEPEKAKNLFVQLKGFLNSIEAVEK